jgi:hypothetical protein
MNYDARTSIEEEIDLGTGALSIAIIMFRFIVDLTAAKRQAPQQIWPQGVRVALVGGEKHMGQV